MAIYLSTIRDWQTSIAAIVGSISSLSVAFIVAHRSKSHEERLAAMLLTPELMKYRSYIERIDLGAKEESIVETELPVWFAATMLSTDMPLATQSVLHEYASKLFIVDNDLSAHLFFFMEHMAHVENVLHKIPKELFQPNKTLWGQYAQAAKARADCDFIYKYSHSAIEHLQCVDRLIKLLIFDDFAYINRVIRRFRKCKKCKKLLINGE